MKRLFQILITLALTGAASFGDIITATVVVTNASNFNGTPTASLTHSGLVDTRVWTNTVTSSSTQIQSSTNIARAAFYLLQHFRSYPFADVQTTSTNNGIVLTGADGDALSLVASNSWALIAYKTNTPSGANAIRAPRLAEPAGTRITNAVAIVDYLNNDATAAIDQDVTAASELVGLANTQTVAGTKRFDSVTQVTFVHSALDVHSDGTNFVADLLTAARTITATNSVNFVHSTNRVAGRAMAILIDPNGTNRNLTFNADWRFLTVNPAVVTNGTIGVLSLMAFGTAETDIVAAYAVEDGGGGGGSDTDDQTAAEVVFTPAGTIAATDVQAALEELDTEKAPLASPTFTGTVTAGALAGTLDAGGATSLEIPNGAAPTVNAFGEIAGDNDLWAASRGAPIFYDGTAAVGLIGALVSDTPSNGQVPKWNTGGTITWEADDNSGGATAINDIGDSTADGSVSVGHTNIWTFTLDGSRFLQVLSSDADNAADTTLLTLAFNDAADANSIFLDLISDADGTPASVFKVSATTFTSSLAFTLTGAIDAGAATSVEVPNGADPDLTVEGQISYDTDDDVLRGFDGANQVALGRKIEAIHFSVVLPNDLADSERDAFWIWENVSGMSFIVTGWSFKSDADDTTLNIEEIDNDGANNTTVDAVEIATNGTGLFYATENGHLIVIDFDDTDAPGQVKGTIYGYFDANVN
jgi:hypothetical protein